MAKLSEDMTVEWIREIGDASGQRPLGGNKAMKVFGFEGGAIAMVAARTGSMESLMDPAQRRSLPARNTLVHLNERGDFVYLQNIVETDFPTFVRHDDINQLTLFAYGEQGERVSDITYTNSINMADSLGNLLWQAELPIKAQLINILRAEDKYLAIINTNDAESDQGWQAGVVEISFMGEVLETTLFPAEVDYHVNNTFSISSDEINLLGATGIPGQTGGDLRYLIISADGEVLFDNNF